MPEPDHQQRCFVSVSECQWSSCWCCRSSSPELPLTLSLSLFLVPNIKSTGCAFPSSAKDGSRKKNRAAKKLMFSTFYPPKSTPVTLISTLSAALHFSLWFSLGFDHFCTILHAQNRSYTNGCRELFLPTQVFTHRQTFSLCSTSDMHHNTTIKLVFVSFNRKNPIKSLHSTVFQQANDDDRGEQKTHPFTLAISTFLWLRTDWTGLDDGWRTNSLGLSHTHKHLLVNDMLCFVACENHHQQPTGENRTTQIVDK